MAEYTHRSEVVYRVCTSSTDGTLDKAGWECTHRVLDTSFRVLGRDMLHVQLDVTIHEEDGTYNIEVELRIDLASAVRTIEEFGSLPSIPSDTPSSSSASTFVLATLARFYPEAIC